MNPAEDIERAIHEMQFRTRAAADERVMKDALAALNRKDNDQTTRASVWRTIMTNRWTRIVPAAAAIIVIAVVAVTMLNKSATKAYAIEQTVEANRGVSFVHFRIEPARKGNANEGWAQFGDNGELLHLRWVIPDSEDGPKDVVWQAGKAEVWLKAKNVAVTVREPDAVARMGKEFRAFTPTVDVD